LSDACRRTRRLGSTEGETVRQPNTTTVHRPDLDLPPGPAVPYAPPERGRPGRGGLDALLSPFQSLFRARTAHRLAVLSYQAITDAGAFAAQMDRLVRTARPVSLGEVADSLSGGRPLPEHSVLVTLDDGHRSAYTHALPVLAARRIPAVAFVITELLGTDQPLWWEEAAHLAAHGGSARSLPSGSPSEVVERLRRLPDPDRRRSLAELRVSAGRPAPRSQQLTEEELLALRDGGVEIGSHTESHAQLTQCDEETVRAEVVHAHAALTRVLGEEPTAFAYPDGVLDRRAAALLRGLGYRAAFVEDQALFDPQPGDGRLPDPLRISRLSVDAATSPRRFDAILSGLTPAALRRRRG
jgi:peptidoglycan/xylan/chitin deacetylase (PgdA/CDA1 family)